MEHQDFKQIKFENNPNKKIQNKEIQKKISQKQSEDNNEDIKIEIPKKLGLLISQARTACGYKSQKEFATLLGVNIQLVSNWENNKITPTNAELANIEKKLKIEKTLPRIKKLNVTK